MTKTKYAKALRIAFSQNYRVDLETGMIYGPRGVLSPKRAAKQRYATATLHVHENGVRSQWSIPVHRIIGYAKYGEKMFEEGMVIRHLDGNVDNWHPDNLMLGTQSENQMDKPAEVRIRMAKTARAAQGHRPPNADLSEEAVEAIRKTCLENLTPSKRLRYGVGVALAKQYNTNTTTITQIWKGKTYAIPAKNP